jgi:hypothetical protein
MPVKRITRKIGRLRKNDLKQFGYSTKIPTSQRRTALTNAVKRFGALSVFRKLHAVSILTRKRSPPSSAVFLQDRDWIRAEFM